MDLETINQLFDKFTEQIVNRLYSDKQLIKSRDQMMVYVRTMLLQFYVAAFKMSEPEAEQMARENDLLIEYLLGKGPKL